MLKIVFGAFQLGESRTDTLASDPAIQALPFEVAFEQTLFPTCDEPREYQIHT